MFVLAGNAESLLPAIGYNNPILFDLFKKTKTILNADSDILVEDYRQIIREENIVFQRDVPATLLYPFTWTTIAHARIHGLERRRYCWDLAQCMSDLWLEEVA